MPTLQASGIADLVAMTLPQLGKLKFTDLMSNYQNTIFLKRCMKKGKMTFESGKAVDFNVITDTNHSAKMVGLDLAAVSLDTVKMFVADSTSAGFKL